MIGLLGKKLGQTRVYDADGNAVPVTIVLAGPNRVLQVKTKEGADKYDAVQLGFGPQKIQRLAKPALGHFVKAGVLDKTVAEKARDKGEKVALSGVALVREFRGFSKSVKVGELVGVDIFVSGDFVDAIGVTKGRGFEGVVKRHGFRGGDSTHGAKGWHRRSGAIGQRLFPGTVMRGMKMPGHMGQVRRTVQNLEVVQVLPADNLILIRGAIPGSKGDYVVIRESKKIPKVMAEGRRQAKADATRAKAAAKASAKSTKK